MRERQRVCGDLGMKTAMHGLTRVEPVDLRNCAPIFEELKVLRVRRSSFGSDGLANLFFLQVCLVFRVSLCRH